MRVYYSIKNDLKEWIELQTIYLLVQKLCEPYCPERSGNYSYRFIDSFIRHKIC